MSLYIFLLTKFKLHYRLYSLLITAVKSLVVVHGQFTYFCPKSAEETINILVFESENYRSLKIIYSWLLLNWFIVLKTQLSTSQSIWLFGFSTKFKQACVAVIYAFRCSEIYYDIMGFESVFILSWCVIMLTGITLRRIRRSQNALVKHEIRLLLIVCIQI
jgi:hypothetical protein